jgi:hypothetical protein
VQIYESIHYIDGRQRITNFQFSGAAALWVHSNESQTTLTNTMSRPAPPPPPPPPQGHTRTPSHFTYPLQTIQRNTDPITYVVHTSYDPASPPPLPGPSSEWTRFVCISDTHTQTFDVPDGDVLIHAGDLTGTGRKEQMAVTGDWLIGMKHPVKM